MDRQQDDAIRAAGRVCFFAHYHPRGIVADYVLHYLSALAGAGFAVVVLSTATLDEDEQEKLRGACAVLILRDNVGLDFGGWIDAVRRFFPLSADYLLLANDSVYGPIGDLGAFIDRLTAVPADFYGAVESHEDGRHLQSWFLLFRPSAYRSEAFARLLAQPMPAGISKRAIIERYELGLAPALLADGLTMHAAWAPRTADSIARDHVFNPTHLLWRRLIEACGIPFLKIELLRDNPTRIPDATLWPEVVARAAPALVPAIRADLAARGAAAPHPSIRHRLDWSIDVDRMVYWPELRGFVERDERWRAPVARRLNRRGFNLLAHIGGRARRFVRRLRARTA